MDKLLPAIYNWYKYNQRNLPWRKTKNPYKIWISEIILQQTRVSQGIDYYHRFITQFPTILHLANAKEDEVLKVWQGLGYYSRARNLHESAKTISTKYNGAFPINYKDIISLKGIGPYTAAAIASIAYDLPYPAIDGNIYRLLSRIYGIFNPIDTSAGKKQFLNIAKKIMPLTNPGLHNQALMEFGALQCTPGQPHCSYCVIKKYCYALNNNIITQLPIKIKKIKKRDRYFYYYFIENGEYTWLEKRTKNDIWKNLYQLPLIETEKKLTDRQILKIHPSFLRNKNITIKRIHQPIKHILSHQIIYASIIHIEINTQETLNKNFVKIKLTEINNYAIPKLIEKLIYTLTKSYMK